MSIKELVKTTSRALMRLSVSENLLRCVGTSSIRPVIVVKKKNVKKNSSKNIGGIICSSPLSGSALCAVCAMRACCAVCSKSGFNRIIVFGFLTINASARHIRSGSRFFILSLPATTVSDSQTA